MLELVLEKLKEFDSNAKLLYLTHFGSKLFGTNKDGKSDTDLKGVYLPSKESMLLGKKTEFVEYCTNSNGKNSTEDLDVSLVPLQDFFDMLHKNEATAVEVFYSLNRKDTQLFVDEQFAELMKYKDMFLRKNTFAFQGFAFKQVAKYGTSTKRFEVLEALLSLLDNYVVVHNLSYDDKVTDFFEELKNMNKFEFRTAENQVESLFVNQVMFYNTLTFNTLKKLLENQLKKFNSTVENVNFKDLSHGLRACYEGQELMQDYTLTLPLKNSEFLKEVKYGQVELEVVVKTLEKEFDKLVEMTNNSTLPNELDKNLTNKLLLEFYQKNYVSKRKKVRMILNKG